MEMRAGPVNRVRVLRCPEKMLPFCYLDGLFWDRPLFDVEIEEWELIELGSLPHPEGLVLVEQTSMFCS